MPILGVEIKLGGLAKLGVEFYLEVNHISLGSIKFRKDSAIRDHLLTCDGVITHDSFVIIGREADLIARRVKESLFIHRDEPSLNVQGTSIPLKLFK